MMKTTRIKEYAALALFLVPAVAYIISRFVLKVSIPLFIAVISTIVIIVIILLLKTDFHRIEGEINKIKISLPKKQEKQELADNSISEIENNLSKSDMDELMGKK